MTDKVVEKVDGDKTDYEQRYNDSQEHIARIEEENATMRESSFKDKELIDAVSPFIDWDAVNGKTKPAEDDDAYVNKKTLKQTKDELHAMITRMNATQNFRTKYPDMIEYEDLVGVYLNKTNQRDSMESRIEKAVENTRKLIESERNKGRESFEKEKKGKVAKEAEASGLAAAKGQKGSEEEPEGESFDDYIKGRQKRQQTAMNL